jgi:TatD DNase family protein
VSASREAAAAGAATVPDLFDTHAHLHFPDYGDELPAVLARARAAGVRRMLTVGTEAETSRAALALAQREPDVWATAGIHPHDAGEADDAMLGEIERLAGEPRVVAVGEIGLDFFRDLSPRDAQERVFRACLAIARRARKPVVIHCRDAHADVLRILGEERVCDVGGIMHCFSGDAEIARRCLDLGLLISLAGPVTYPNARALPDVARLVPPDRFVVETDCPFLPPQGYRGKRNEPAYLVLTATRVAELRGESLADLAARTTASACALLGIP